MTTGSVLIIDDDEVDRYLLKRLLKETKLSVNVFEADNGKSALDFLNNPEEAVATGKKLLLPLIIFLDVNMPVMKGPEFLDQFAKIRERIDNQSCVIMMFSSAVRKEDRESVLHYDFVKNYLVKGAFNATDLRQCVQSVIGHL